MSAFIDDSSPVPVGFQELKFEILFEEVIDKDVVD